MPEELFKSKPYHMKYAANNGGGCTIVLPFDPHKGVCMACGKSKYKYVNGEPEIKITAFHHWVYAYKAETVRNNPILVLDNTVEICWACHKVADALRDMLYMSPERTVSIMIHMPKTLSIKFALVCNLYLEWYNKQ